MSCLSSLSAMVVVCVVVMLLVFGAVEGEVRGWFVDEVFLGYELGECGVLFVGCCGEWWC